jgi:hypothetical protein
VDPTAVQADADVHDTPAKRATEPAARLLPAAVRGTLTPEEATARGESRAAEAAGAGAWPPAADPANSAAAMTPAAVQRLDVADRGQTPVARTSQSSTTDLRRHHDPVPRCEPTLIAAASSQATAGSRCGTFSQAELTAELVTSRIQL